MICYKDMTFCNAKDCAKLDCPRNTRGSNFKPDDWWKDKVCIGNLKDRCQQYEKEQNK